MVFIIYNHPLIYKIYGLSKPKTRNSFDSPMISVSHKIAKYLTKIKTPLLNTIIN